MRMRGNTATRDGADAAGPVPASGTLAGALLQSPIWGRVRGTRPGQDGNVCYKPMVLVFYKL